MRMPDPMVFKKLIPAKVMITVTEWSRDTLRAGPGDGPASAGRRLSSALTLLAPIAVNGVSSACVAVPCNSILLPSEVAPCEEIARWKTGSSVSTLLVCMAGGYRQTSQGGRSVEMRVGLVQRPGYGNRTTQPVKYPDGSSRTRRRIKQSSLQNQIHPRSSDPQTTLDGEGVGWRLKQGIWACRRPFASPNVTPLGPGRRCGEADRVTRFHQMDAPYWSYPTLAGADPDGTFSRRVRCVRIVDTSRVVLCHDLACE